MKVIGFVSLVILFAGQILASDNRLSEECLNGIADRFNCCVGVPDAWFAHLRNPEDCGSFYQCESGKPTWKACPEGLEWSVNTDKCDWPQNAQCTVGNSTVENTNGNHTTGNDTENGGYKPNLPAGCYNGQINATLCCEGITEFWVHLPDPENCGRFYQCDNGKAVHENCPTGLHWSVSSDRCVWPHVAGCLGNSNSSTNTSSTTVRPTTTERPSTTVKPPTTTVPSPPPKDQCGPGPVCHQCVTGVFPSDLCCKDVKTYHKINLANAKNCSSYYTCVNDHAVLRECPKGLHWSIETDRCEWPQVAKCNASNGNGGNGNGENGNGGNGGENNNGNVSNDCLYGKVDAKVCCKNVPATVDVLLQNNADCHTYFQCVHGEPMVRPCPAGLWWSVTANRCEWKENATCTW